MTDYRDGKNHGWNGGECPVHPKDEVMVWMYNGYVSDPRAAKAFRWDRTGLGSDIVCFRVTKKHEEPLTVWVNVYSDGDADAWFSQKEAEEAVGSHLTPIRIAVPFQEVKE